MCGAKTIVRVTMAQVEQSLLRVHNSTVIQLNMFYNDLNT